MQKPKPKKVEPIRKIQDIARIKEALRDQPRNLALFTLGVNTNLRASDLVRLTADQFQGLRPGDSFEIREKKTGKLRRITINKGTWSAVDQWLSVRGTAPGPLFLSQRRCQLCVSSVHRLVKSWCRKIALQGNYGSHTLRKTWGYHAHQAGKSIPVLMTIFNHASQKQTLDYLCIQDKEIQDVYMTLEL